MSNFITKLRDTVNYIFVASTINDSFFVSHLGDTILKILLGIFIVINVNRILSFQYGSRINIPFFCLVIAMMLSIFINAPTYPNIILPVNTFIAICAIYIVFSQEENPVKYMWCYVFAALFSAFLCITADSTISEYEFRKTGGMSDPNEFSITILIPLGFLFGKLLGAYNLKKKIIITVAILFFSISLLFAGSKSAVLTLAALLSVIIGYILVNRSSHRKILIIGSILLIFVVIGWGLQSYYGDTINLFINRFGKSGTAQSRFLSWKSGFNLFEQNPIFGVGLSNYANMIALYFKQIAEGSRASHNMFVQVTVELGIAGLIPFLWLIIKPIYMQVRTRVYPIELVFSFLPFLLMGFTLSLFTQKYIWIFLALIYNIQSFSRNENS